MTCSCDTSSNCDQPYNALDQAVQDALAGRMTELEGYTTDATNSATESADSAAASAASALQAQTAEQNTLTIYQDAQALAPVILETSENIEIAAKAVEDALDNASSITVKTEYYTVVGGETSFILDAALAVRSVQAIYIEGIRQDRGHGFNYDAATRTVTLTEALPVEAAGSTITLILGTINADSGESITSTLASSQGGSMIGTTSGETVQQILNTLSGSFAAGARLRLSTDTILDTSITPNQAYRWGGTLPKTVFAGSTLASTGGIATNAWIAIGDPDLRASLAGSGGYTMIGGLAEHYSPPVTFVVVDNAPYNGDFKAALETAVPGNVFWLGKKTHNITGLFGSNRNTVENITIVGAGMPQLSGDRTRFVDGTGTIIQGSIKNQARGFKIFDVGIDCGNYVSQSVYPTETYEDALQQYAVGTNANLEIDNVKTLNAVGVASRPGTHSILLEQLNGVKLGYVECIGGFHGLTIKCQGLQGGIAHCYGQYGDAFIFKSDSGYTCASNYMERIIVGLRDNTGWPDVSLGGIYDAHDGVNIDDISIGELIIQNAAWGLIPSGENTGYTTNVRIGKYFATFVYGNYYSLTIDKQCVGWTISQHNISNASGGIRVDPASAEINIGTGKSKNNTESGYALGGNSLMHGKLFANDNGKAGVDYLGGLGFDASLVMGYMNATVLISGLPGVTDGSPINNWANTGAFSMDLLGKLVHVSGSMTRGDAAVAYNTLAACRPLRRVPIPAWGVNADSSMIPVECYMESSGQLNVAGFASIPVGGTVYFNGTYLTR